MWELCAPCPGTGPAEDDGACVHAGVNVAGESNPLSWLLLNSTFLLGTFTFAVILGVVSDDITQEVKRRVCTLLLLPV